MKKIKLNDNLQYLMKIHGDLSISELARQTQLPQPTLHHILSGTTKKPRKHAINALAKFFSISAAELIGAVPLPAIIPNTIKENLQIMTVPIVEWEMLNCWPQLGNNFSLSKHVLLDKKIDKDSFALIMKDSSMEPIFPEKSILIFDSGMSVKDRNFAIVYLVDSQLIIFNRLFIDGSDFYIKEDLQDGNAKLIKLIGDNFKILGVLIEIRMAF